jgi:hypothetical protein
VEAFDVKGIQNYFKSPLFLFPWQPAKFVQPIPIFLAYLVPLAVDVLLRVDFFQNGCSCHGNCQNSKKLKNTKMIIAGYSPNRN